MIVPIGEWVLREACRQAKPGSRAATPSLRMAVNLSPRQFQQTRPPRSRRRARSRRAASSRTPSSWRSPRARPCSRPSAPSPRCAELRELGVRIALDDFGTGHSVAQLPAQLPHRPREDRPRVHPGDRHEPQQPRHRLRHHRHGPRPRPRASPPKAWRPRRRWSSCASRGAKRCRGTCSEDPGSHLWFSADHRARRAGVTPSVFGLSRINEQETNKIWELGSHLRFSDHHRK